MSFKDGIIYNSFQFFSIITVDDVAFKDALDNLGMKNYVSPSELKAEKGKNIIVISLESFEMGFFTPKLAHLTPNLTSIKDKWNYFDMKEVPGAEWTSGSLYASITGLPAFFNIHGNDIFQTSFHSYISGIGHILNKSGYDITYLIGDATFSGTEDMLLTYQFDNIIDKRNFKNNYALSADDFVHDKDLFNEARLEVLSKIKSDKPFALYISTLSTHFPDGLYDKRMEGLVPSQKSEF